MAPVGTLADFLEVERRVRSVVDEFLRDELNYIVVKAGTAADARHAPAPDPTSTAAPPSSCTQEPIRAEGITPLKDTIRVLNGFGRSLEAILPKLKNGYIVESSELAQQLSEQHTRAFFLTPGGECFHNTTVTGGKPASEGPLALKRDLRETEKKLASVESALNEAEANAAALTRTIEEIAAQLEARSEERRQAERDTANQGAALKQMESEVQRIDRRLAEWTLQATRNARALKQRLEAMGPVNMMALEEYNETAERHAFLETQRKDLLDSIENTQASIKEIDDVSRIKFDEAFKIINENFRVTFTKLFGGGQAFMRSPTENSAAESGIDIVASPPGKKLQNILLLSGGEKALTALSLLVGIFQFQPAPFCVLDEVDAPLDETNVGRFAKLISEMSATTQFVVITHSKRTMEQADVIYGVTMQEPGVSKIVSV
jgi:chromosome segregation protein